MAKARTVNPVLDGVIDVPAAPASPVAARTLTVAVKAGGPARRYRAGLGPFTAEPVTIGVTAGQAEALAADPWLSLS